MEGQWAAQVCGPLLLILTVICQVPGSYSQDFLVFADSMRSGVFRMDATGGDHVKVPVPALTAPVAIGFDTTENNIYVTGRDPSKNREKYISRYGPNSATSFARRQLPRVSVPDGLAVDPISRLVYYTDAGEDHIAVTNAQLSWHAVVLRDNLDNPRGITLDPLDGMMYWTDFGSSPHIGKANMDGSEPSRLVTTDLIWPFGLTIDIKGDELFWCDAKTYKIERVATDGSNRRTVLVRSLEAFFGLAFDDTYLYWTAWNRRAIQRARRDGTGSPSDLGQVFTPNTTRMHGLVLVSSSPTLTGSNVCSGSDRGGCQQLCLPRRSNRTCACTDGSVLNADGLTCDRLMFRRGLVMSDEDRDGLFLMDLDRNTAVRIAVRGSTQPQGIVLDPVTKAIFWSDAAIRVIVTGTVNGARVSILKSFNTTARLEGIALDPVARILYIADSGRDVISSLALNGTVRETILIDTRLDKPRALGLDLSKRMMYWTDWAVPAKIERARLDGTSRMVLVNTSIGWPNGLVVDARGGRLYWTDGLQHRIESSTLEGTDRKILLSDSSSNFLGLAKGPADLFFSIRNNRTIYKLALRDRHVSAVGQAQFRTVYDLQYFPPEDTSVPGATQPPVSPIPALPTMGVQDTTPGAAQPPTDIPRATQPPTDVPRATQPPTDVPRATQPPTDVPRATRPPIDVPGATRPPVDVPGATPKTDTQPDTGTMDLDTPSDAPPAVSGGLSDNQTLVIIIAVVIGGLILLTIIVVGGVLWYKAKTVAKSNSWRGSHASPTDLPMKTVT